MSNDDLDKDKRRFLTAATAVAGGVGTGFLAWPFLASWRPSARAKAAGAPVVADISKLEVGARLTVQWRGRPVWIVRRTPEMLEQLEAIEGELRDPQSEEEQQPEYAANRYRSVKPEILVMIGQCTHLGCSPLFEPTGGQVEGSGFFCPCHGSKFDIAGRVYKGVPAPLNMPVPPHRFEDDNIIVIGEDPEGVA